jgi:hypothetical protein
MQQAITVQMNNRGTPSLSIWQHATGGHIPETQDGWFFFVRDMCPSMKPDVALQIVGEVLTGMSKGSLTSVDQVVKYIRHRCGLFDQGFMSNAPQAVRNRMVATNLQWAPMSAPGPPQSSLSPSTRYYR